MSVDTRVFPGKGTDPNTDPELREDLIRLRMLLEQSDWPGARAFVKELAVRWPLSRHVQHYAEVLQPPAVRLAPGPNSRPLDRENAWLRAHGVRDPKWWERAVDTFIHSELIVLKLPFLFLNPFLKRRTDWADASDPAERLASPMQAAA